jgi:hypothetical protein
MPQKGLQAAHELDESLRLSRTMTGGAKNEAAFDHPGNAVVKPLTVGLNPWEAHERTKHFHSTKSFGKQPESE